MKKLMFCAMIVTLGVSALWAEGAYLESNGSAGAGINSRYFFNPKSRIEVDYALTDASIKQARVWGMDATSPMASLYVQGTLNVAFGSGDTFVNTDTATGLPADTLRHTAILDVANRQAVYMTGTTTNWSNLAILATHAPSTTATIPLAIFAGTSNIKAGTQFYNYAKMKLYRIKFFTDGVLVHDYLPCVKGGMPGLRDQVDGVFVTGENIAAFSVGGDVETIDDDPWIAMPGNDQTSGWQSLNTGYRPKANTRLELDYALYANYTGALTSNGDWYVFAGRVDSSSSNYYTFYYNKNGMGWSMGGVNFLGVTTPFPAATDDKDVRRTVVFDSPNKTFAVVTAGFTNHTDTCTEILDYPMYPIRLGCWLDQKSSFAPLKIYSCRFYEDGTLVRDLQPCVQDGIAGLKDSLTGEFMACGTRTYGGPIPHEQGDGYIESAARNCSIDTGYTANSNTCIWADWALTSRDNSSSAGGQPFVYEIPGLVSRIYGNGSAGAASATYYSWTFSRPAKWTNSGIIIVTNVRHQAYIDSYGDRVVFMNGACTNYSTTMSAEHMTNHAAGASGTLKLFSNASSNGNFALMRLYGFKIWDAGTLVRDYVPCVTNGLAGLYDRVNGTFVTEKNNFFVWGGNIETDGSGEDAYIESDGTQAIATGCIAKPDVRYEIDYQFTRVQGQARVFATTEGTTASAELYVQGSTDGSGNLAFGHGATWGTSGSVAIPAGDRKRRKGVFDLTTKEWTLGEFSGTISTVTEGTSTYQIGLFAKCNNAAGTAFGKMNKTYNPPDYARLRIYSFRIYEYENGVKTLKHELLPYKKGDVVGMYDTQTGEVRQNGVSGANALKISGKGVDGAERWIVTPQNVRLTKRAGTTTLSANATGAISYRWTLNGEAVAGGEDGDLVVEWEKAKSGVTETYAVTPVYDICGNAVEGEPVAATVEHIPDGTVLIMR